jgi:fibronectin type 3 domain-containing protein
MDLTRSSAPKSRTNANAIHKNRQRGNSAVNQAVIESLEARQLMSTNVLNYRDGQLGTNTTETTLSPANVKTGSFGKLYTTALDGNVYAEPLLVNAETITAGVNTTAGAAGTYNVVYAETENDSIYAINSVTGAILWKRSFLNTTGTGTTTGTDINNPLSATTITTPTNSDAGSADISPVYGITGTPVIDLANNRMYVVPFTKEMVNSTTTFVLRIHAINLSDGTDQVTPYQIGSTTGTNNNTTSIYVYGSGDGSVTDPYNNTGKSVVQFNALRQNQRSSLALVNGVLFISFASHGDDFPYHGWVTSWNVANLTTSGFVLNGVFCTSPNGGGAGVWGGGGGLQFDPDEANTFYLETGNGFGQGSGISLNAQGFPNGGAYFEAVVKLVSDTTTSPTNQNTNGWGFKVVDYFIPYNQAPLDNADQDLGSGSPLVLPDSAGIAGHPHLLLAAGKQGVVYVIDRDNMGHYDPQNDHVLNSIPNGTGNNTPPISVIGVLSTPVYYNGTIYYISGYSGAAYSFTLSSTGALIPKSTSAQTAFGYLPGSPTLSSNGNINGIIWQTDRANNELHAYDANSFSTELWNSNQAAGGADAVGSVVKFASPTVADGEVFVGTSNALVVYGLQPPVNGLPTAPTLSSVPISSTSINLTWADPTTTPNTATAYSIEQLISGTWTVLTTAPGGTTSLAIGGLTPLTSYSFRIRGLNGVGYSTYSNISTVTTSVTSAAINFSSGFNGSSAQLAFNGSAAVNGNNLQLTNAGNQAASVFANAPVAVAGFTTSFQFQTTAGTNTADGFTFTLQNSGLKALGSPGGALGYQGITPSVAIKFDLYSNAGEGVDSTGLFTNGTMPTTPSLDMTSSGVNLHSGDPMTAVLSYNGTTLSESVTDTITSAVFSASYPINISAITGATAYAGFTAGTGGQSSNQQILNWTFSPNNTQAPAAPSALSSVVTSATSINLSWTNNATNQTGYLLDRATDAGFTQNLITQTLPGTSTTFTDTAVGLASGGTYYYRIRSTNSAGSSANSNVSSISIPFSPAKATNCVFDSVTSTSITMHWTDNAGATAQGYHILRSVNGGSYTLYTTLPANAPSLPGAYTPEEYDWTDTGCAPGTYYDYHIQCFNVAGYNDFVGGNATTLTTAPSAVTATAAASSVSLSWSAPTGAVNYNLYRGTAAGAESATPLATGITATSYVDSSVTSGNTYYYYVTAVNANTAPINAESAASLEVSASIGTTFVKLSGTPIGTAGSWNNVGNTITNVFDGNFSTFFDPPTNSLTSWVGLDLGYPQNITQIKYAPRAAYESRMVGGQFQVSSTADFSSNVVTLATITTQPVAGAFTTIAVNPGGTYRYVRYVGGTQWMNIAEMEVDGTSTPAPYTKLPGTPIGTPGSWNNNGNTVANAFDGNLTSFFDPPNSNLTNWAGLDLGSPQNIAQIKYAPRAGWEFRMVGGQFQVSSTPDFSSNVVTLYTVTTTPVAGQLTTINVTPGGAYRYVRFVGGTGWVNIAEMEVDGIASAPTYTTFTGLPIGTPISWNNNGDTIAQVFDGNLNTFFDAANSNLTNWVGLDLGSPQTIAEIQYAPRAGFEWRMVGGQFQVSSTPDFSSNVVTLYTIPLAPTAGVLTTIFVNPGAAYRYVRYVGGTGWVNIAEMVVQGIPAAPTYTKLSGTPIGTPTSWKNNGDTIAQVFDGSFSTYYDAPNSSLTNWVGLDLGSPQSIDQIKFAPRASYEWRMVGGEFQVSNTADFSSNVVTIYTITQQPVAGQFTTVPVSPGGLYRYVRYVGGTAWVNIAEMEVDSLSG